jgi:hypothetical protein
MGSIFKRAPWQMTLVILSLICPSELSLYLGGVRLPPHRLALIIAIVAAAIRFLQKQHIRLLPHDYLFLIYGLWTIGVFMQHLGEAEGLQFGGSLALESFAAYFVTRVYVTDLARLKATVNVLFLAVMIVGGIAMVESALNWHFVHELLRPVTGYVVDLDEEYRLGFLRAYSTFDHPIHYGAFVASTFALIWTSENRIWQQRKRALLAAGATFLGLSSAPMLSFGVQTGLIAAERFTRTIPRRVILGFCLIALGMTAMSLGSNRTPFAIIATGFTLDPWTGFYRLVIWEWGLENVWSSPWTGIGLKDWFRPWWMISDSVDAYWLVIAMRAGVPAFLLHAAAVLLLLRAAYFRRWKVEGHMRTVLHGWTFSIVALTLAGCTVHYWNTLHSHLFVLLGLGAWIADPVLAKARAKAEALRRKPKIVAAPPIRPAAVPVPRLPDRDGRGIDFPGYVTGGAT